LVREMYIFPESMERDRGGKRGGGIGEVVEYHVSLNF